MKRNLICLALALCCVCMFFVYRVIERSCADTQPPTIAFSDETMEFSAQVEEEAYLQGVTAYDKNDGDVTDSLVVDSIQLAGTDGTIYVTYAAFDKAGNVTKAVRTAKYIDYKSTRFSLSTSMTFAENSGFDLFKLVRAEDMLDGDISHRVRITALDETGIATQGTHRVELRVSNSLGETVKLVIPVEVYASGTYDAQLTLKDYLVYLPQGEGLDVKSYLDTFTAQNTTKRLNGNLPRDLSLDVKNNVQPDVPGVYTVEYRVKQTVGTANNTKTSVGYAKLIVVVEG